MVELSFQHPIASRLRSIFDDSCVLDQVEKCLVRIRDGAFFFTGRQFHKLADAPVTALQDLPEEQEWGDDVVFRTDVTGLFALSQVLCEKQFLNRAMDSVSSSSSL